MTKNNTRQRNIAQKERLLVSLYCSGVKLKEIAKKIDRSYDTVRHWVRKPHIQAQIAEKTTQLVEKNDEDFIKKRDVLEKIDKLQQEKNTQN